MTHPVGLWRNLSISKKLFLVFGIMAVLIGCELVVLRYAMGTLSAVRAFVGGEGLWSKAQKDAIASLQRYGVTKDESDYRSFLEYLKISEGDHRARIELIKPNPNLDVVRAGFIQGHIHPRDITPMIELLRGFSWVSYLAKAIQIWGEADVAIEELKKIAARYHDAVLQGHKDVEVDILRNIKHVNEELSVLEDEFSFQLGEGSRWVEYVVFSLLFVAVMMVESIGLTMTFLTSRSISKGLKELNDAAHRLGRGEFGIPAVVHSSDEIGQLAVSVNQMGLLLKKSYGDLEARVQERTAELVRVNTELQQFAYVSSHDLKEPLRMVTAYTQLLAKKYQGNLDQTADEYIASIVEGTTRMHELINDLLEFSTLDVKERPFQVTDCNDILKTVLSNLQVTLKETKAQVETQNLPQVSADPIQVAQLFQNLISNAVKFTDDRCPEVKIDSERSGDFWRFSIKDNGIGIASQYAQKIFVIFQRLHDRKKYPGTGIGLAICKKIVERHGGKIWVESAPGQGSTFYFTLKVPADLSP